MDSQRKQIVVAGGGLAGLTAAKRLLDAGHDVEVLEARPVLGGKASAWKDEAGDWIESGLHVFFGAYEEIYDLMRELGIYENILWKEHVLTYTLGKGERFEFRTMKAPSPIHLLPSVFKNRYFTFPEKLTLGKALLPILFGTEAYFARTDELSYQQWHRHWGIADRMLTKLFLPMTLALKFLAPADISARVVLDVAGLFLRQNEASRMGFLDGSPAEKLVGPLADFIRARGGRIRTGARVGTIHMSGGENGRQVAALELADGEIVRGDAFVLALPIHQLKKVMPAAWNDELYFANLRRFEGVPVITVQLWFDRQITFVDNILFCPDGIIPVYADLGNTTPDYRTRGNSRMEFVVAPARDLFDLSDEEIIARVWRDLQRLFPATAPGATIAKSTVVRIPQSVYWPKPGLDAYRPSQASPISNLALAGGYTRQRFYDSMEGAVQSGNRAAAALVEWLAARQPTVSPPSRGRPVPRPTSWAEQKNLAG